MTVMPMRCCTRNLRNFNAPRTGESRSNCAAVPEQHMHSRARSWRWSYSSMLHSLGLLTVVHSPHHCNHGARAIVSPDDFTQPEWVALHAIWVRRQMYAVHKKAAPTCPLRSPARDRRIPASFTPLPLT
jgi:hypothetical protein